MRAWRFRTRRRPIVFLPAVLTSRGSFVWAQLAEALAHAHAQGICHRDLKPSNILMLPEGRPLLLDFNLSVDDRHPAWRIGGTLPYMAPEELSVLCEAKPLGGLPEYDPRSDLFSLGVILYQLLAGELPFGPIPCDRPLEAIAVRLRQRQAEGPRPLRKLNGQVDERLARLIGRCLQFDPKLRPEKAHVLAAALREELTLLRRTGRWLADRRRPVLLAASILALMLLGTATFLLLRPP